MTLYNLGKVVPTFADPQEWSGSTEYEKLTFVIHNGNGYISKDMGGNINKNPASELSYWQLICEKGDSPAYEWDGTSIRFKNPNGAWGAWANLKGEKGDTGDVIIITDTEENKKHETTFKIENNHLVVVFKEIQED